MRPIFFILTVFFVALTGPTLAQSEGEAAQFDIHAVLGSALAESCPTNPEAGIVTPTVHNCGGFGPDFFGTIHQTEQLLIERLHEARAREAAARAEAAVLAAHLAAEEMRRDLLKQQLENGTAVPIDAHFDVIESITAEHEKRVQQFETEAAAYWEALTAAQEELTATQGELALIRFDSAERWAELSATKEALSVIRSEAAESCRRNEEAGAPLSVCDQPGHQAALERKP